MQNPEDFGGLGGFLAGTTGLVIMGAIALVFVLGWCRIFSRTGMHGALGLLMLVPIVNLFMFLLLAFGRWPMEREAKALRRVQRAARETDDVHYRKAI